MRGPTPETFTPYAFIGVGATCALFTLREAYLKPRLESGRVVGYEVRSHHLWNLSTSADEAIAKATTQCGEGLGLELRTSKKTIEKDMREIKRATAKELAEREARDLEREALIKDREARRRAENIAKIDEGVVPFGRYEGTDIAELPRGYLNWLIDSAGIFEPGSAMAHLAAKAAGLPLVKFPEVTAGHVGTVKERREFSVTVTKQRGFSTDYGYCYVTTMVDDGGHCLIVFSGAFAPKVGDVLRIKATIKRHDEYKNVAQTTLQRVTILKDETGSKL